MTRHDFETLYQKSFSSVYHYVLHLCRNKDLAEELTSQTFFKAINAINKFDKKCNLNSWLCQIAKYTYFDYLREHKHLVELDSLMEQEDLEVNIERQLVDSVTSEEICEKVRVLEEPYKKVFLLRIFKELSFKQIASIFGKTENWACVTYHRARKKLKERMEE